MAKVRSLFASGAIGGSIPDRISVERPKNRDHGDFATSVALQLAKDAGFAECYNVGGNDRFQLMEQFISEAGLDLRNMTLTDLDIYWDQAKQKLKTP